MLSHQFYNVTHVVGIILLMAALGGAALHAMTRGANGDPSARRLLAAMHGVGVLLILVGGFGMLARIGAMHGAGFPGWVWVKLVVWGVLAAAIAIPPRRPGLARPLLLALPILGGIAAYMAIYKPV